MKEQGINHRTVITVISISALAVITHWNIWSTGTYALGFNTTLLWLSIGYLVWGNDPHLNFKRDWQWGIPLVLIILSFSLFENPWLKLISCFLLPISAAVFYAYSQIPERGKYYWNLNFLNALFNRVKLPLQFIKSAWTTLTSIAKSVFGESGSRLGQRVGKGLLVFLPIAALVLILLGSADQAFSNILERLSQNILINFNWVFFLKALCILLLAIGLMSGLLAWQEPVAHNCIKSTDLTNKKNIDSVVAGIVMIGVTVIYGLFLLLQLEHLIVDTLPIDFTQAEQIVKSGFWQLFFLSILNVALFFTVYKNTTIIAQIILRVFIIASGFLLLSAAWRMGLYVYYYGLSYEKFFASYTTLFALFIFVYLVNASFIEHRKNIFRFIAFCSLWSYGIATTLPIEKIILNTNIALTEHADTRVKFGYLQALSADVLKDIQELKKEPFSNTKYMASDQLAWNIWLIKQSETNCKREWYEQNISLILNCKNI